MPQYNIKEFKELRDRYNNITLKEINDVWIDNNGSGNAQRLTGFGCLTTCTLCKAAISCKNNCIWCFIQPKENTNSCSEGKGEKTYDAIFYAKTPKELLKAFHNRAKLMTKIINKYEKENI